MPVTVQGYGTSGPKEKLAPITFKRRDPRPDDITVTVLYCGVCHTDLHQCHNDWKNSQYPVIPGHEIVGRVTDVGVEVKNFKVGDLAGIGYFVDCCHSCNTCKKGICQYCEKGIVPTSGGVDRVDGSILQGGYSEKIMVSEHFAVHIPHSLDLKAVPPLLCAGITTWSPLRHWKVGKESTVGVVGLGGLGHMALKLAKALGAKVTLFTHSPRKEADARKLGADGIVVSDRKGDMEAVANSFDLIIDTVPCLHDITPYLPTLKVDGTIVLVGFIGTLEDPVSTVPLVTGRRTISGSIVGGIKETQELLDFCGEHNVLPEVEMIKMGDINEAYERLQKGDVKYRFVIDMSSLKSEGK